MAPHEMTAHERIQSDRREYEEYVGRRREQERFLRLQQEAHDWARGLNQGVQGVPQPAHPKKSKNRLLLLLTSKEYV